MSSSNLLGAAVADEHNPYSTTVGVIGEIEQSGTGYTVLRIGHYTARGPGWVGGAAHVVLTPEERERLIAALVAHREQTEAVSS